jgi:hypothetical protein
MSDERKPSMAMRQLTRDEARRIAANIAKLLADAARGIAATFGAACAAGELARMMFKSLFHSRIGALSE